MAPTDSNAALVAALFTETRAELLARSTPLSTYRVQLHKDFNFTAARKIIPYLARLGISTFYASPYLRAMPGSQHGYDVIDHTRINPEVGTAEEHAALCQDLLDRKMTQLLDTVPNHMGVEHGNALWDDVLENGPASRYARFFDVDWVPVKAELLDKVLLPVLGEQYGVVLERGELQLRYANGAFQIAYFDKAFPLGPRGYQEILKLDLATLEKELGPEHAGYVELQSIITSIDHLPQRTETERAKVLERNREKEVVKRRLEALASGEPKVAEHIERNVAAFNGQTGEPRSFDRLDDLIARFCSYRLAHWRVAGEEINYRRFFDINGLAAIRVEDPEVFDEAHALVFKWIGDGLVHGLRIDHPDGLFDPTAYFLDLQERFFIESAHRRFQGEAETWPPAEESLRQRFREEVKDAVSPLRKALYVLVEKIQGGRERIPDEWAVHGTTGYRFANAITGIFVDRRNERAMNEVYDRFLEKPFDFKQLLFENKRLIMRISMASEINVLAHELNRISEMNRRSRDFTLNSLRRGLVEFIAHFPVYRTYVDGRNRVDARDIQYITWTIARAKEHDPNTAASIFDFLEDVLLGHYPEHLPEADRAVWLRFAMKLQQLTGPVMAKGLEDTVFYIYNRLTSLNEVGGEPERFGTSVHTFHLRNQERAESWPAALVTSSTHDTKRSEDVRARISVLSEIPQEWQEMLMRFSELNLHHKTPRGLSRIPTANDEYLFYQTVLGALPMKPASLPDEAWGDFTRRLREYMAKATKEAKVNTSWTNADPDYDAAMAHFVDRVLDRKGNAAFLKQLLDFQRRLERPGQLNALGQAFLKLVSPGVPDVYQGCELWELSLVDPDNRRPVDYGLREAILTELDAQAQTGRRVLAQALSREMTDGRVKLYITAETLRLRQRAPELFRRGLYQPLEARGERAEHWIALTRTLEGQVVIAAAPRLTVALLDAGGLAESMAQTVLVVPSGLEGEPLRNVFTGETVTPRRNEEGQVVLELRPLLEQFPVLLLTNL